jgi:excisionase family DNA binding protein
VNVAQAAERLGISGQRVRWYIKHGRLAAKKVGRDWLIEEAELARFERRRRPAGRPQSPRGCARRKARTRSRAEKAMPGRGESRLASRDEGPHGAA